jgi:hypothetical protein
MQTCAESPLYSGSFTKTLPSHFFKKKGENQPTQIDTQVKC